MKTKDRIIFNPNIFRRQDTSVIWDDERFSNFYYSYPLLTKDTYILPIPEGYEIESTPSDYIYENENTGLYFYSASRVDNKLVIFTREKNIRKRVISRESYKAVNDYYSLIMASDDEEFIFKRIVE